ncbi:MAG: nucleotidyltransferase domain-containing protein [Prevotellaceae bacterium]|jgi:predicted nucleotidyltransferase|nr:nucleotidyltransferase domain-containing protein [Prevotellaceae bacterium]
MIQSSKHILSAIQDTLRKVAPQAKAILYGSRARGDNHVNSDWDILILLDKEKLDANDFDDISYPLYELGWQLDEVIIPKLYTVNEWLKRKITPFYKNIEREGIVLL